MSKPRRTWPQRLLIAFNSLLVVVCLSSAAGLTYVYKEVGDVPRINVGSVLDQTVEPGEPQNFLLVGVDDGSGLAAGDPTNIGRVKTSNTDTMMVLRVDPKSEKASLLSLPRDLWVDIPGGGKGRLNSAMALGGPEKLIQTIQKDFGIPINHFVQVDFAGFKSLVSAVDGVPIYFPWAARDTHTGFIQEDPGCSVLVPDQALDYARSRYFEINVGKGWVSDPSSDYGRISRQQQFIKAALKRAVAKGIRNPFTLNQLIGVAQQSVTLDSELSTQDLVDLGSQFRSFDPDSLDVYTPPTRGGWAGAASVLFLDQRAAQPIFDVFRGVDATYDPTESVRVEVRNGSGAPGQGRTVLNGLGAKGFGVVRSSDAGTFGNASTTIRFVPGQEAQAVAVARYLDGSPVFVADPTLSSDVTVALVTGADFTGIRADPRPVEDFQAFIDAQAATTTTSAPSETPPLGGAATTSSIVGDVPQAPEGVACG